MNTSSGGDFGIDPEPVLGEDIFNERQTDRIMAFDVVLEEGYQRA